MRNKLGHYCTVLGILLLLAAIGLWGYNYYDANRADEAAQNLLTEVTMQQSQQTQESAIAKAADDETFLGTLACSGHAVDAQQRSQGIGTSAPITLEDNVWIGANSTICGGVTIGADSVIGAGSVVTHDIPTGVVAAGVPCKVIRRVAENDKIPAGKILF